MPELKSRAAAALALKYRTEDALSVVKNPQVAFLPGYVRQLLKDQAVFIAELANDIDTLKGEQIGKN